MTSTVASYKISPCFFDVRPWITYLCKDIVECKSHTVQVSNSSLPYRLTSVRLPCEACAVE